MQVWNLEHIGMPLPLTNIFIYVNEGGVLYGIEFDLTARGGPTLTDITVRVHAISQ